MTGRTHTREDSGLVIDGEGRWFHDGEPIENERILAVFNQGLARDEQGRVVLRVGADWCVVTALDAPVQVLSARAEGERVLLELSTGTTEPLAEATLELRGEVLYCTVSSGLLARFGRSAQFSLGELLEPRGEGFALNLGGREYVLPVK